jgi:hypothetical protein
MPALGQDVGKRLDEDDFLRMPSPERLFTIRSEAQARVEIREAALKRGVTSVAFPADANPPAIIADPYACRPAMVCPVPLARICYHPLYFQDIRAERDARSCGVVEPFREAFLFYGKSLILPEMMVVVPPWRYRCWDYPFEPFAEWTWPESSCRHW